MTKKQDDTYVGDCIVCGVGIHKRGWTSDGHKAEDEHYVVIGPEMIRCTDCAPGSQSWLDSPLGQKSKYRKHFEVGREQRQEQRQVATARRAQRVDLPSPLLKSFAGRIKYFIHMRKVSGEIIPWKLELVDNGFYYVAEYTLDETLTIEANGMPVPFEPKDKLTERLKAVTP
jgi:hypothetical protein